MSAPLVIGAMQAFVLVRELLERELGRGHGNGAKPTLLDVGCRRCGLRSFVEDLVGYEGADLFQHPENPVAHVLDLEQPLPFPDGHFDFMTALGVVEHVDRLAAAVEELVRVTKRGAMILLPNSACMSTSLQFLTTGFTSEKYSLTYPSRRDRHRLFPTQLDADRYFEEFAAVPEVEVDRVYYMDGPLKTRVSKALRTLGASLQRWTWATVHIVRPRGRGNALETGGATSAAQ